MAYADTRSMLARPIGSSCSSRSALLCCCPTSSVFRSRARLDWKVATVSVNSSGNSSAAEAVILFLLVTPSTALSATARLSALRLLGGF